jgi:hypothetical protein
MQTSFPFRPFAPAYTETGSQDYSSHHDRYPHRYRNPPSWHNLPRERHYHPNDPIPSSSSSGPTSHPLPHHPPRVHSPHGSSPHRHIPFGPILSEHTTRDTPSIPNMDGFPPSASTQYTPYEPRQRNRDCVLSDLAYLSGNFLQPTSVHSRPYHARPRSARVRRPSTDINTRVPWLFHTAYARELPQKGRRGSENSEQNEPFSGNYVHSTPTQSRRGKGKSVHWGQTQFLSESDYYYDCESSQEPIYHIFRDHHGTSGRYHMSGAVHPLDHEVFNILNPELNLDLNHNSGVKTGRTSPEVMVNRPDYGIGDDSVHVDRDVDAFASVDPFRRERANGGLPNFRIPTAEAQKDAEYEELYRFCHLGDDIRQHKREREHLDNFCPRPSSPSFFHTYSYAYDPTHNPADIPLSFSAVSSNFNPTVHRPSSVLPNHNFRNPSHFSSQSQNHSHTSPHQTSNYHHGDIRILFAELDNLHASLLRKRRVLQRLTVSLRHDVAKVSLERARLRNQRKRYRQWCEQARDEWQKYETWQQCVREKQRGGTRYWEGSETGSWGEERGLGFDEDGVEHANESIPREEFEDRRGTPTTPAPPNTPRTSRPRSRPWSQPHSEPYQAFPDNTNSLIHSYNRAWGALNPRDYSSSIPWPSDDLSALAIDKPTTLSLLAEEMADDIAKLREWNVFCFFTRAYMFAPSWNTKHDSGLEFSISANGIVNREGQDWGLFTSWYNSWAYEDLLGLKKQLKIEATRWHPDKLGNREMSLEDRERAKSVFHGIGRVKSMVKRLEEAEENTREF